MSLVDCDLLSIQEARIIVERAEEARVVVEGLPDSLVDGFLAQVGERLLPRAHEYAEQAFAQSDYGTSGDEEALIRWVLTEELAEVRGQVAPQQICKRDGGLCAEVRLPKGLALSLLPDWLAVPTLLSQALFAIKAKCPIAFSARPRVHGVCEQVMADLADVAEACHYPVDALAFLETYAAEGEQWLANRDEVRVLIDSREHEHVELTNARGKDVYFASVGNNPVFVERTANLALVAEEVVAGKSFACGMLPCAEQSLVVEQAVEERLRGELEARGCHFLTDEEAARLMATLYDADGLPYRELIGKSACDLARRAEICVPEGTRVLVIARPYVSEHSLLAGAKHGPVLAYYVEPSWQGACEKCIELILSSGHGNALAIFSEDAEVIRQFILKKPVGRILVNASTGLGGIGWHSTLAKTLTVAGWDGATSSETGVTYRDFVRKRQVGFGLAGA